MSSQPESVGATVPPGGVTVITELRTKLDEKPDEKVKIRVEIKYVEGPSYGHDSEDDDILETETEFSKPEEPPALPTSSHIHLFQLSTNW